MSARVAVKESVYAQVIRERLEQLPIIDHDPTHRCADCSALICPTCRAAGGGQNTATIYPLPIDQSTLVCDHCTPHAAELNAFYRHQTGVARRLGWEKYIDRYQNGAFAVPRPRPGGGLYYGWYDPRTGKEVKR